VPPDQSVDPARRWLRWAEEDLQLAIHVIGDSELAPRGACTWAHQAAEKALKALLVAKDLDPPRTHDLDRLAQLAGEDVRAGLYGADLTELTRWSIEGRYPSDIEDATSADARRAIEHSTIVVDFACNRLQLAQ
jgi:HEPN domain-containing protein